MVRKYCLSMLIFATRPSLTTWALKVLPVWRTCCLGQMGPKDVVQSYWKPNLHILPGGKRPANAGVLLSSETMKLMVEQALTQYDYVIIDTAPLTVSNDGAVFGRWAKGLLLVVSRNVCEKKSLQEAARHARHRAGAGAWLHLQPCRSEEGQLPLQLLLLL